MNKQGLAISTLRKISVLILSTLFILGFLIWILSPIVAKTFLNNYFQQHNAQLIIKDLDINPFKGVIRITDAVAFSYDATKKEKEKVFSLKKAEFGLSYGFLFAKTIHVNTLTLEGLDAKLMQSESAWHIAGLTFPIEPSNKDERKPTTYKNTTTSDNSDSFEDTAKSNWKVHVPKIQISNTNLTLERFNQTVPSSALKDTLVINKIMLSDIKGKDDIWSAKADVDFHINKSIVRLQSTFFYNPERMAADITFDELTFDSTQFSHYFIEGEPTPQVLMSLSGDVKVEQDLTTPKPTLAISSHDLSVLVDNIKISTPELTFSSDNIHFEAADLNFSLSNGEHFTIQTEANLEATSSKLTMISKESGNEPTSEALYAGIDISLEKLSTQTTLNVSQNAGVLTLLNPASSIKLHSLSGHINDIKIENTLSHLVIEDISLEQDQNNNVGANGRLSFNSKQLDVSSLLVPLNAHYQSTQFVSQFALNKTDEKLNLKTLNTTLVTNTLGFTQDTMNFTNDETDLSLPTLNMEMLLKGKQSLTADLEAQLSSKNTYFKNADDAAQYKNILFSGHLSFSQNDKQLSFNGKTIELETHDLSADQAGYKIGSKLVKLSLPDIQLQQTPDQDLELKANPQIELQEINVFDVDNDQLMGLGSLSSSPIYIQKQPSSMSLKMDEITLSDTILSKTNSGNTETPHLAKFAELYAHSFDVSDTKAIIQSVVFTDLQSNLLLDEKRALRNLVFAKSDSDSKGIEQSSVQTKPEKKANGHPEDQSSSASEEVITKYHLQLDEFKVEGESSIYIQDEGISPSLNQTIYIDDFQITQVDTSNPKQATHVLLNARNGKYATIHVESDVIPLNDTLTMQTKVSTKEIELTPFSPYISDILGYTIESGQLDADIRVNSDEGQLTGNSTLLLRRFDLGGKNDQPSNSPSVIPLNLAIGALKDSQNNISLNIPMSGNIDNPKFQWENFLIIPIRKALYSASSSYLMQTLVPYANVISIVQIAGEQLLKLRVEPLHYEPEKIELSDSQLAFTQELAALLTDKKDAQLKMCSIAVPADLGINNASIELTEEQIQSLKLVAQTRAEHLKDSLINLGKIASSRLLLCAPTIDSNNDTVPRIEFEF